jgi:hypothetical protein
MYKIKGDSGWGGRTKLNRNVFSGFKAETALGHRQSIFGSSYYQPDYTPMLEFTDTTFIDVEESALAWLEDPHGAWAVIPDCGNFPCSGPKNVLYSLKGTTWEGETPDITPVDFQVIHNNSGFAPYIKECTPQPLSNTYICEKSSLSVLHFESQDLDRMDRSVQPVNITLQGTGMLNVLNAEMDHTWDGFYTGQKRTTRFPSIIDAVGRSSVYDIVYTGTPPKKQLFELYSLDSTAGTIIRIAYPSAMAYQVKKENKYVSMNQWDDGL